MAKSERSVWLSVFLSLLMTVSLKGELEGKEDRDLLLRAVKIAGALSGEKLAADESLAKRAVLVGILHPSTVTGVERRQDAEIPTSFQLHQNFPNPFNPTTDIQYDLAAESEVSLIVYNLLGQEVATLVQERQPAGAYMVSWNGRDVSGREVPSGIYFYRIQAGTLSDVRKAVLLR